MKKKRIIWIVILFLFVLAFTNPFKKAIVFLESPVLASLPAYKDKEGYTCGGFQDFTDYFKYYYDNSEKVGEKLKNNIYFKPVSDNDIQEITDYFENFEGWIEWVDYKDKYDFDLKLVDENDFWYVDSKYAYEGNDKKFYNYDLYFFDVQSMILYFIHNNI